MSAASRTFSAAQSTMPAAARGQGALALRELDPGGQEQAGELGGIGERELSLSGSGSRLSALVA
jgi:hypothetical protein